MKQLLKLISVCAAIGAVFAVVFFFRDEITDFVKNIINRLADLRDNCKFGCYCGDFRGDYDDYADFDDVDD